MAVNTIAVLYLDIKVYFPAVTEYWIDFLEILNHIYINGLKYWTFNEQEIGLNQAMNASVRENCQNWIKSSESLFVGEESLGVAPIIIGESGEWFFFRFGLWEPACRLARGWLELDTSGKSDNGATATALTLPELLLPSNKIKIMKV